MNHRITFKSNQILVCLIIGLTFLWNGSSYISWLYNLLNIIDNNSINVNSDMLFDVYSYIMQVIGAFFTVVYIRYSNHDFNKRKIVFILMMLLQMITVFPSLLSKTYLICLFFGFLMNVFNGIVNALYFVLLVDLLPSECRGITFGLAYSIGSIGSWVLSLINAGNFLKSQAVLIAYLLIMAITVFLSLSIEKTETANASTLEIKNYNKGLIYITAATVFLLCTTKSISFYFPIADVSNGNFSLELSRAFYAIGLIIAGLLNDYKRLYGGISCIAALMFPFVLLAMTSQEKSSFYIWILSYIFISFYNVFRILIFADLADRTPYGLYLAPMGLMWGRLGDAVGSAIGISLSTKDMFLIILCSIFFAITIILTFYIFPKIYIAKNDSADSELNLSPENKLNSYAVFHDLSTREKEVLPLILEGRSNSEISGLLFVSENTVKFHVRNILKKTGCSNRQELAKKYQFFK